MMNNMNKKLLYASSNQEDRRLLLQNGLLNSFDDDVYQEALRQQKAPLTVLDVGCGTGSMLIPKLQGSALQKYLGIDKCEGQLEKAREKYNEPEYCFACIDLEDAAFAEQLKEAAEKNGIEQFSIINVSMVLLHVRNPQKVLAALKPFLKKDGVIIVREIDDGLNYAYPDEQHWFEHVYQLCLRDEISGNRYVGRTVYAALNNAGFSGIQLKRQGLSTAGLNPEQKDAYYHMSFGFILGHAEAMYRKYPDNEEIRRDYAWAQSVEQDLYNTFMKEEFLASLGFMIYTAGK